jgi:GT2 family glycosyltransferase
MQTVNMAKHRIHVIDNASCKATKQLLQDFAAHITIHTNGQNLGTAKAINIAWQEREPGEHCIKMDNDVVIHQKDWADDLELAIELDPKIGIVGLKRKDCWENPNHENPHYRSTLELLGGGNHGWIPIERVNHVMGTCQMFNSDLLDKIGYLYQPRLYGFDDALAAIRCQVAGFYSCFLPSIEIDHIDTGETPYQTWKEKHSGEDMRAYNQIKNAYLNGSKSIYSESTW